MIALNNIEVIYYVFTQEERLPIFTSTITIGTWQGHRVERVGWGWGKSHTEELGISSSQLLYLNKEIVQFCN